MGGKKKPTLSQLVKKQEREQVTKEKPTVKKKTEGEKQQKAQVIDTKLIEEIKREVSKWDCITPYLVASKFNIKISTAIHILRSLKDEGYLYMVSKGHRTEVYVTVNKAKTLGLLKV